MPPFAARDACWAPPGGGRPCVGLARGAPAPTDIQGLTGTIREAAEELDREDMETARLIAEQGAEQAGASGFEAVPVIARGKPKAWPTLLALARRHEAVALVVGSRGLGCVQSALLGSVSSGVLDHARLPVLIVPPAEDELAPGPVLIGYDGSDQAGAAIEAAGRLLSVRETVLNTVWLSCGEAAAAGVVGAPVGVVIGAVEKLDTELRQGRSERPSAAPLAAAQGLEVRAEAVRSHGNVWSTLLDTAHSHRAAAVVVGSRGRSPFASTVMGSVSRAGASRPAPVLVVRPPQP